MESKSLLPCLQEPATGPYPEPSPIYQQIKFWIKLSKWGRESTEDDL